VEHSEALEQEECAEAQVQVLVVDNICGDHPELEQSVVPYMDPQEEHV